MKKTLQKIGILFLIFLAGLIVYFFSARNAMEKELTVYSAMEEPTLPVVYTKSNGKSINCLYGYLQDMGNQAAREAISVLPSDRMLSLEIEEYGNTIAGIQYEVRNLSMERLIERTEVEDWRSSEGKTTVTLPIQNLLTKDQTYFLILTVSIGEKEIRYYTRIIWPSNNYSVEMIQLAEDFTTKSLDYEQARDLVTYLETSDTEDNSSLGHVTIKSSFNHLTWDGLDVEIQGTPQITLKEYDGIMGQIQVRYRVTVNESDGSQSIVDAEDNFTMKWSEKRIYIMNYERYANEIFNGDSQSFSGKRILLGISNDDKIRVMKSPNSRYLAFKTGGDLWCYDQTDKKIVRVFTFESSKDDGVRSNNNEHDVKVLSVDDDGTIGFLVYGYMNRGKYEGKTGVVFYSYDKAEDTVRENFYIPSYQSYEGICSDVGRLSYLNPNGMIYILLEGSVYGIDLTSNESLVVVQGLAEGSFAVSEDGSRFAWQEGTNLYEAEKVHVMDFNTAEKQELVGQTGDYIRVLGFVGNDLIYGLSRSEDKWVEFGREKGNPMYAMYIVDTQMQVMSEYYKDGIYISDVSAEDGRVHLKCLVKLDSNLYMFQNEDTIVCNQKTENDELKGMGWYASQDKGRVYYVQAGDEIKGGNVKISAPKAFSYENTATIDINKGGASQTDPNILFHAYGGGQYMGVYRSLSQAVSEAFPRMGYVTDSNQHIVWDRINRQSVRNIKAPIEEAMRITKYLDSFTGSRMYEDGVILMDAGGCSLNQMLYFIDKGIPVIAYIESGRYVLLSGYDQYNITLYDPQTQESAKMGQNDAIEYFKALQNDFLCAVSVE